MKYRHQFVLKITPICNKKFKIIELNKFSTIGGLVYYKGLVLQCQPLQALCSIFKSTFAEITTFPWKLKLCLLNQFTGNLFMITEYKTFLSLLDSSWAVSICMTLKLCLRKFKGCLFEGCFLTIFSISLKKQKYPQRIYVLPFHSCIKK